VFAIAKQYTVIVTGRLLFPVIREKPQRVVDKMLKNTHNNISPPKILNKK
jgi:hypothetical protein